jgi:hypothetical protein
MEKRLIRFQLSLRDTLLLFGFISCILGLTVTRLTTFRALHAEIRLELDNSYQLESDALVQGNKNAEQIAQVQDRIERLDGEASQYMTMTLVLFGITTACFALAIFIPRIQSWMTRGPP